MAEIILTTVVQVLKCLAPPAYRQISYLRESKYTSNLQNLKTEVESLKSERVSTQHLVDEAKRKGEEIEENVENWLASANNVIVEADKFTDDEATANKRCFKGFCPNLNTRRGLNKEVERQKKAIVKVREAGRFDRISYRTAPEDIRFISSKDYEAFESRMPTLRSILSALEDPDVNMLGIYGMGGIGKTMLAEEVARKIKSDKIFDQVVFAEVSLSQDIRKIQGEIADKLGLKFHEESEPGRANSLFKRIKEEKKILVILDNIWENLDLRVVGIPHGDDHRGCKILLTARSLDVLSRKMDSQQNFAVGILKEEEAWSLFKKMAGDYIEGSEFQLVAREVEKECAGLPVSIVTVARALRNNKSLFDWKDALEQLRRPPLKNFMNIQPNAHKAIKLSYDNLGGEELKNVFLLIGYTVIESIDDLLMYGMGLGLFQGVSKMEEARARVHTLVHKLKASCMLLDHLSKNEEFFSMHDVVRDVAISIASSEHNVFSATEEQVDGCREWSEESAVKLYTSIVLRDVKTNLLPELVECPQLKLFLIHADKESPSLSIANNFFERMIQVRVINLSYVDLLSLPSSLVLLSNLRTLSLYYCKLLDISGIGDLKKLEFLCLRGCDIRQLPIEVGELICLKSLDLRDCSKLEVIPPHILSNLSHLEELNIGDNSFYHWEVEVDGVKNASLNELKHLTSLQLRIKDINCLPRGLFFEKLERYRILIGDFWNWKYNICSRDFRIGLSKRICLKDVLIVQLQGIEHLGLYGLQEHDVKSFANELVKVGSSQLKHLWIEGCHEAHDALNSAESKRREESTNDMRSNEIILEDRINISNILFNEKGQVFPSLEELSVDVKHIAALNKCQLFREDLLCKLKCLDVEFGDERTSILSLDDFLQRFHAMKVLKIVGECYVGESEEKVENGIEVIIREANKCCDLKHILKQESSNMNNLVILHVIRCNNLINLVPSSLSFQNLTTLKVSYCKGLMKVLTSSIAKSLVRLKEMRVSECNMITEIVLAVVDDAVDEIIVFSELKDLELCELKSMTSFCSGHCAFKFPSLERILVNDCPSMKIFSGGELSTPKLLKVQLDEFNKELWTWERDLNTTIQTLYLKTKKDDKEEYDSKVKDEGEDARGSYI